MDGKGRAHTHFFQVINRLEKQLNVVCLLARSAPTPSSSCALGISGSFSDRRLSGMIAT